MCHRRHLPCVCVGWGGVIGVCLLNFCRPRHGKRPVQSRVISESICVSGTAKSIMLKFRVQQNLNKSWRQIDKSILWGFIAPSVCRLRLERSSHWGNLEMGMQLTEPLNELLDCIFIYAGQWWLIILRKQVIFLSITALSLKHNMFLHNQQACHNKVK